MRSEADIISGKKTRDAMAEGMEVVLASGSRNRRSILASLGVKFRIVPSEVDERSVRESDPVRKAKRIAQLKARAVAAGHAGIIIAADTFGVLDGEELQKPRDLADARRMLGRMSGRKVRMVTGVCIVDTRKGKESIRSRIAWVRCKRLSGAEIDRYVRTRPVTEWAAASNPQDMASAKIFAPCGHHAYGMDRFSLPLDVVVPALVRAGIKIGPAKRGTLPKR